MTPVKVKFSRKPVDLDEVLSVERNPEHFDTHTCEIIESIEFTEKQYDTFTKSFMRNHDWLNGKGGYKELENGFIRQVIEVSAPNRQTLFIDPSGYSYARYVGLAQS